MVIKTVDFVITITTKELTTIEFIAFTKVIIINSVIKETIVITANFRQGVVML